MKEEIPDKYKLRLITILGSGNIIQNQALRNLDKFEELLIKKAKEEEAKKWHNQLRDLQKHETKRVIKERRKAKAELLDRLDKAWLIDIDKMKDFRKFCKKELKT